MRDLLFALHGYFLSPILSLLWILIIVYIIMSWLFSGGIIDNRNPTARNIWSMLHSVIEPMARPLRRILPPLGQFDLSVLVIILAIPFVRDFALPRLIALVPF